MVGTSEKQSETLLHGGHAPCGVSLYPSEGSFVALSAHCSDKLAVLVEACIVFKVCHRTHQSRSVASAPCQLALFSVIVSVCTPPVVPSYFQALCDHEHVFGVRVRTLETRRRRSDPPTEGTCLVSCVDFVELLVDFACARRRASSPHVFLETQAC